MSCESCQVLQYKFDVRFHFEESNKIASLIAAHLQRQSFSIRLNKNELHGLTEEAIREVLDFCADFYDLSKIEFTTNGEKWKPFTQLEDLLQTSWVDDIILNNRIICYSQPILSKDGTIFGYEVLARFTDENGQLLMPNQVFDAARKRGRLYALDRSCRLAAVCYAKELTGKVFINFIPTSIYSPEHCLRSTEVLAQRMNIEPKRFIFEVVESEKVEDLDHLKTILAYYRQKGFEYALDDVGSGFSTAEVLRELAPHYMKLDRAFVDGVAQQPKQQEVAKFFLERAQSIGAIPLAEGIESVEDYLYLKNMGYELFQGYLFSKPQPKPVRQMDIPMYC